MALPRLKDLGNMGTLRGRGTKGDGVLSKLRARLDNRNRGSNAGATRDQDKEEGEGRTDRPEIDSRTWKLFGLRNGVQSRSAPPPSMVRPNPRREEEVGDGSQRHDLRIPEESDPQTLASIPEVSLPKGRDGNTVRERQRRQTGQLLLPEMSAPDDYELTMRRLLRERVGQERYEEIEEYHKTKCRTCKEGRMKWNPTASYPHAHLQTGRMDTCNEEGIKVSGTTSPDLMTN